MRASPIPILSPFFSAFAGCCLVFNPAAAHDMEHAAGTVLFIGGGVQSLHASDAWPVPRLPGVLEAGSPREDARGEALSYLEFGLTSPLPLGLNGELKVAKHGESADFELESAWIAGDMAMQQRTLTYKLGRQLLPLGLLNQEHSHAWAFGAAPIALRAAINDTWQADGLRADLDLADGISLGMGIWRNEGFPGAPSDKPQVGTLRAGWLGDAWQVEVSYAHARADGRALTTLGSGGHSHSLPSCGTLDANRVCFEGDVDLLGLAARWSPGDKPWWIAGEWHAKQDQGRLDSLLGTPDYQGKLNGGWLDFGWTFSPRLEARLRVERAVATHDVAGANATLVANQAGILNSDSALLSHGAVVNWRPAKGHFVSAEWHHENIAAQSDDMFMLRYQYTFKHTIGRGAE